MKLSALVEIICTPIFLWSDLIDYFVRKILENQGQPSDVAFKITRCFDLGHCFQDAIALTTNDFYSIAFLAQNILFRQMNFGFYL